MARLEATCEVDFYSGDETIPHDEMVRRVAGKQGLISMVTDTVDRSNPMTRQKSGVPPTSRMRIVPDSRESSSSNSPNRRRRIRAARLAGFLLSASFLSIMHRK